MAVHVMRGAGGQVLIRDDGWTASLIDGRWREGAPFSPDEIAGFSPLADPAEADSLARQARAALGRQAGDPFHARSNDEWPESEA
jgi:hypothetical protein